MPLWKKSLIVVVSFLTIIFLFNSVIMPWYVKHDTLVKVPSVTGLQYPEAQKVLEDAGLEAKQGDIRYDPSKPIGSVMEQNPPADQVVKYGRRIYLVISGGEQVYDVPNLVGRTEREARFSLSQRNLQLLQISTKTSVQYPAGIIVEQIYPAGTKVKKGTSIGVVVSTGIESGNIKVPDLTGKNVEEAKKIIMLNKLSVGKITSQPSTSVAINSVIDQYPKANSMAKENDRIDLFVNREIKKKVVPLDEEMNSMEEINPEKEKERPKEFEKPKETDKPKDIDKEKKPDVKKDDKSVQPEKKDEKKKTDKPKDTDKKDKDDGGTKY
jgi:eukaryotic-like serine/threonine-protein kinase